MLLAFVLTASSAWVAPAAGQTTPLPGSPATEFTTHIADDAVGDVQVCDNATCQPAPQGRFQPADLKSLDVKETNDAFAFIVGVASLQPSPAEVPGSESGTYSIMFQHADRGFRLNIFRSYFAGVSYGAQLQALDPARHAYFTVTSNSADLEVKEDLAANTITATILHRDQLADGNGAAPHPEVSFTGWRATSRSLQNGNIGLGRGPTGGGQKVPTPTATDAMPDSGNATAGLPVHFGVLQTGHARLHSLIPSRASNGEATTFVFKVTAQNLGRDEDRFTLSAVGVPSTWQVKLPAEQVTIPGNGTLQLLVLVTTPFAHQHGKYLSFVIEAHSVSDATTVGRIELGVRYSNPPQPAGHHPQLWIHSQSAGSDPATVALQTLFPGNTGSDNEAYMNAEEIDPNEAVPPVQVPGDLVCEDLPAADCQGNVPSTSTTTPVVHYEWAIPLSPGLDMGLDFDMAGKGSNLNEPPSLKVAFANKLPMQGAVLSGHIMYYPPQPSTSNSIPNGPPGAPPTTNQTIVARFDATAPVDVPAQNPGQAFTTLIHPAIGGDYIAFQKGASLVMFLNLNFTRADPFFGPRDAPMLVPGGTLTLPLFEYHDPISDIYVSTVELVATSKADRFVNPGKAVLFNVTLVNHGDTQGTFLVEMTGTHAEGSSEPWARLLIANPKVTLAAGGSMQFAVAVDAPAGAQRPDAADLVLTATGETDFAQRSLLHLYAVVDTTHEWPDQRSDVDHVAGNIAASSKTPGLELVAIVAALGACALLIRRRAL